MNRIKPVPLPVSHPPRTTRTPAQRKHRFSLRALIMVVTIVALTAGGVRWWLDQPVSRQVSSGPVDFPFSHQLGRHQQLSGSGPYGFRIVRWEVNGYRPISSNSGLLENNYREALTKTDETWVEIPFHGFTPSEVAVACPRTASGRNLEVRVDGAIVYAEPLNGLRAEFIDRHNPPSLFENRNSMLCSRVTLYVRGSSGQYVVYEVWLERSER